ncbi:linoleate 13S-lipoxygenase 2-1, chloroplastic-like [Momordica charantia]|uniref:Lipoxygenase n=1 Tax=Momordica charantia TaxID=3673 RepID=A0A6J1DHR2_MOMCH|nr:linoleate 13S-lipoxygenase 2-1, chloroplastic-like [Momordica charantia]
MLKGQGFGCSPRAAAPASLRHLQRPLLSSINAGAAFMPHYSNSRWQKQKSSKSSRNGRLRLVCREIKAALATAAEPTTTVQTKVVVKKITGEITSSTLLRDAKDVEKFLKLEFASNQLDPRTGSEKPTIRVEAKLASEDLVEEIYEASFEVGPDFGEIGAVIVENPNEKEMYIKEVDLTGLASGPSTITCNSWVQPPTVLPKVQRVFFTSKSYLPFQTPAGLKSMRAAELVNLRGNGTGERKATDRIYDYDVYNDLGDCTSEELKRPVLGGPERPYPRRCRTGRPHCTEDPDSEERTTGAIYVPRDETFSTIKQGAFNVDTILSVLRTILPRLQVHFDRDTGFKNFKSIDALYDVDGFNLPPLESTDSLKDLLPWIFKLVSETGEFFLRFQSPEPMDRDKFFWLSDEEFARQTLAGLNPCSIQLVTEWPLVSKLDPEIYGPPESAFNTEMLNQQIGSMTVQEAIQKKKLYILDYHDMLLPYVQKVRALKGTTLYGSRTLFFLNEDETLRPLAIELTRPPMDDKPQWKRVYGPSEQATHLWIWRFAKAHVLAHDAGYHQLVSHWVRTHCAVEPYCIATNRQLSAMHPIYRLLHPHFRYTLEINAAARSNLINAGGTIETTFSPLKYSMELSSTAYDLQWQFDLQALPADLIHRGLAEEDPTASHGLRLNIKDYPFANDGLILWDALKQWVTEYVNHYYPDPYLITSDTELQAWWTEIRTVGHADKKDAAGWPTLNTPQDLIEIVSNIAWVASAHHAAVNFGQYAYAGYFPNRPSIARTNMPTEDPNPALWKSFLEKPEDVLLDAFPSQYQATQVMMVLDVLSSHSPDEEYIGKNMEPSWGDDPVIKAAFDKFNAKMKELELIVDLRNADLDLKNRTGAGVTPYELLKPFSGPGVTGKGVPYSVSI